MKKPSARSCWETGLKLERAVALQRYASLLLASLWSGCNVSHPGRALLVIQWMSASARAKFQSRVGTENMRANEHPSRRTSTAGARASVFRNKDFKLQRWKITIESRQTKIKTHQMIVRGNCRDGICGVTEHLSMICQRCGGLKLRVLLRSDPNRIPERSGHKPGCSTSPNLSSIN